MKTNYFTLYSYNLNYSNYYLLNKDNKCFSMMQSFLHFELNKDEFNFEV